MAAAPFHFKKFSIEQAQGVHPVGTDGVLLGAWANPGMAQHILDVGAGTGLVALMLAQRSSGAVQISAIDPHEASFLCCKHNFGASPWPSRLHAEQASLQDFQSGHLFDLIVSNPPFFSERTFSPDPERTRARHISDLSLELLLKHTRRLLAPQGRLCVILPEKEGREFCEQAVPQGLYCNQEMQVRSRAGKPVERLLLELSGDPAWHQKSAMSIHAQGGAFSETFRALADGFYLNF